MRRLGLKRHLLGALLFILFLCGGGQSLCGSKGQAAAPKTFTLVIDAGHGGKDPGAIGKMSREKNINLAVALAFGRLVEANCPDVNVVYTRKTDIFVPLDRRAEIANKAKADLFISIHTNALPKGVVARGAETYTLGMARADANLEVAKRENSAILIENDYERRYQGFNPRSAESYIIFEFMQDKYMEQSVKLARLIQQEFRSTAGRTDKGVHQAGFLVLRATSMPSALIELGYISTPDEERFLNSDAGVRKMSRSIYNAFLKYKRTQGKSGAASNARSSGQKAGKATTVPETTDDGGTKNEAREQGNTLLTTGGAAAQSETGDDRTPETAGTPADSPDAGNGEGLVFKVQILTSDRKLPAGSRQLKGLKNTEYYRENNIYKYTWGATTDYPESQRRRKEISAKFPKAFVVAFKNGKRMDLQEAIREYRQNKNRKQ